MKISTFAAGLVLAAAATSAMASVTVNSDGSGFVGKGDVQLVFGWNNAMAQANANNVAFSYNQSNTYVGVCEWITGTGTRGQKLHTIAKTKTTDIVSGIAADARKSTTQYTGWNLLGFGGSTVTGDTPVVGGACAGEGTDGAWTSVELQATSTKLMATVNGVSKEVPITPVAIPM